MHMSLVRRVLRNPFSLSSASVTASTSIELESAAEENETWSCSAAAPEPAPLLDVRTDGLESATEALMKSEVLLGLLMMETRETAWENC